MKKKLPALFAHIPFYALQAHEDCIRWCHMVESDIVWFKRFGIKQNYNKNSSILFANSNIFLFISQFFKIKLFYLDECIILLA